MRRIVFVAALVAASSVANAQPIAVTLSEFKVGLSKDTVKAGVVTFRVKNTGAISHGFWVTDGNKLDKGTPDIPAGQEATLTVTLKAGVYDAYCPVSDLSHQKAGMTRKLVVLPADAPAAPKKPGS
jgi:uncharacterized cupredoxin-like copper-binding protein